MRDEEGCDCAVGEISLQEPEERKENTTKEGWWDIGRNIESEICDIGAAEDRGAKRSQGFVFEAELANSQVLNASSQRLVIPYVAHERLDLIKSLEPY